MLTEQMQLWLGANIPFYEGILTHAVIHDPTTRQQIVSSDLTHEMFSDVLMGLIFEAAVFGARVYERMGIPYPAAPSLAFIETNARAVNASGESVVTSMEFDDAMKLAAQMLNPELYREHWSSVPVYFEAWYGTSVMKRAAIKLNRQKVLAPSEVAAHFERVHTKAAGVFVSVTDDLAEAMEDSDETPLELFTTGFYQLDNALGGGMALGEAGIIFGGTGAGKSVIISQMIEFQISKHNYVDLMSTEMKAIKYLARIAANRLNIDVRKFRTCKNWRQIEQVVATTSSRKLTELEKLKHEIDTYLGFKWVDPDTDGKVRAILDGELLRYEKVKGRPPSIMFFDWIGRMADQKSAASSSERSAHWERTADEYVKFGQVRHIAQVIAAQAVNGSEKLKMVGLGDIGVGKGISKPMSWVAGITNTADADAIRLATEGRGDMPDETVKEDQFLCPCKTRDGSAGPPIPLSRRNLKFQRFEAAPPK